MGVVDRAGLTQSLLRDRFPGAHTPDVPANKAWTAVSFRTPTAVGGDPTCESAGSIVGALGVSGAPSGDAEDVCARAGIAALRDDLEL